MLCQLPERRFRGGAAERVRNLGSLSHTFAIFLFREDVYWVSKADFKVHQENTTRRSMSYHWPRSDFSRRQQSGADEQTIY